MNPYRLLGVAREAGDKEIRRVYLEAIKKASPETDPRRFAELSQAYEQIKDERSRNIYALFSQERAGVSPIDAIVQVARRAGPPGPLPLDAMKEFLLKCLK